MMRYNLPNYGSKQQLYYAMMPRGNNIDDHDTVILKCSRGEHTLVATKGSLLGFKTVFTRKKLCLVLETLPAIQTQSNHGS